MTSTTHPLPRAVYETILRDEAHHRRLAGLYFEWAMRRIDDAELVRLGRVLLGALQGLTPFWRLRGRSAPGVTPSPWKDEELNALGWLSPAPFAAVAKEVVVRDILDPLSTIGITISANERADLLAD